MLHAREDYNRIQDPLNLIGKDEPVFLLRAKDRTAPYIVEAWANEQRMLADADIKAIQAAEQHAQLMKEWQLQHGCKTADI